MSHVTFGGGPAHFELVHFSNRRKRAGYNPVNLSAARRPRRLLKDITAIVRPLSPITYFRRNLGRTLPLGFVIVLSVFLIASVVTIVNSIDLTVLTIYGYTRYFNPVIPRAGHLRVDAPTLARIAAEPDRDRTIDASGFFFNINTVFGSLPFVCLGVDDADRDYLMHRAGDSLGAGRMPKSGLPEAVVSEGIVRNRKLKIGDIIASPDDSGSSLLSVPDQVKLVGILNGPTWLAFTSKDYTDDALPLVPHSVLVTTHNVNHQVAFGDLLYDTLDKRHVQVFSFHRLVDELRKTLSSMYLIMALVNGTVIFVVALMAGMLSNIYFTQRVSEFAVLAAIGLRRRLLVWHAVSETAILTSVGWVVGILVTWAAMSALRGSVFEPRGMLINPHDPFAYMYTLPIPLCISLFAVLTLSVRLSQLDPVTIIERR
jgi:hypothetical protein